MARYFLFVRRRCGALPMELSVGATSGGLAHLSLRQGDRGHILAAALAAFADESSAMICLTRRPLRLLDLRAQRNACTGRP